MLAVEALSLAILAAPTSTPADAAQRVHWQLAPGCPDARELDAQLDELVDWRAQTPGTQARAQILPREGGYALALELRRDGETLARDLEHQECGPLARAAVLVIAIQLSPLEVARALPPVVAAEPVPAPPQLETSSTSAPLSVSTGASKRRASSSSAPPSTEASSSVETTSTRASPRDGLAARPRGAVQLLGAVGYGALPTVDGGGGVGVAVLGRQFRVGLRGLGLAPNQRSHPQAPQVEGRFSLWAGALELGPVWRVGPVELTPVALLELGVMTARAEPLVNATTRRDLWAAAGLSLGLRWPIRAALALTAGVEGLVALHRPRFVIGDLSEDLYLARAGGGRVVLGIELRFPKPGSG